MKFIEHVTFLRFGAWRCLPLFEVRQAPLKSFFGCHVGGLQFLSTVQKGMMRKVGFSNLALLGGTTPVELKAAWGMGIKKRMETNASRICFDGFDIFK